MSKTSNTTAQVNAGAVGPQPTGDAPCIPFGGSTIPDFAKRWKIPESTVWLKISQKKINVVRLGPKHTRISYAEEQRIHRDGLV